MGDERKNGFDTGDERVTPAQAAEPAVPAMGDDHDTQIVDFDFDKKEDVSMPGEGNSSDPAGGYTAGSGIDKDQTETAAFSGGASVSGSSSGSAGRYGSPDGVFHPEEGASRPWKPKPSVYQASDRNAAASDRSSAAGDYSGPDRSFSQGGYPGSDGSFSQGGYTGSDGSFSQGSYPGSGSSFAQGGYSSADGAGGPGGSSQAPGTPPLNADGKHVWEEEEPKYDTQTGERLDKPKSRIPGVILTAVVTACAAGTLIYALIPGNIPSGRSPEPDLAAIETELQTEREEQPAAGALFGMPSESEVLMEKETETASESAAAAETEAAAMTVAAIETEAETAAEVLLSLPETEMTEADVYDSAQDVVMADAGGSNLSDLVRAVMPSVVSVTAQPYEKIIAWYEGSGELDSESICSGFIFQEDEERLYILTDRRAASAEEGLTVGFYTEDGNEDEMLCPAKLEGIDTVTSLALITVEKSALPAGFINEVGTAQIRSGEDTVIGESSAALGNTLLYGPSVLQGIVCAAHVPMESVHGEAECILTDIPVNALNSGGPLVSMGGEVIGIVLESENDESAEGLSRVLPFETVTEALDRINNGPAIVENLIAEGLEAITAADEPAAELSETETEEAPLPVKEAAGLILFPESAEAAETEAVSESVPFEAGGEESKNSQEPEKKELPETEIKEELISPQTEEKPAKGGIMGVEVGDISEETKIIERLPDGIYILTVMEGSGAAAAGLLPGDVIMEIDGQATKTVRGMKSILDRKNPGDTVEIAYLRADDTGRYREKSMRRVTVTLQ